MTDIPVAFSELSIEQKYTMRNAVRTAVKHGVLTRPSECSQCGRPDTPGKDGRTTIHAHHHNGYGDPLDVQWLCSKCHRKETPLGNGPGPSPGEKNPRAKLTERQAREILASPLSSSALSQIYGVGRSTICDIKRRLTWEYLDDSPKSPKPGRKLPAETLKMLSLATENKPAPRIVINGHAYIPEAVVVADRAAQAERMARLEEALREARDEANDALILAGRLNGGEELQTLMRLNNDLLARATNAETLLRDWLAAEDAWDCNAGDDERVELAKQAARRALSQEGSNA